MLLHHPIQGEIILCNYEGFRPPEMVKSRPVVVVSPRNRKREGLVTVIPLSNTAPDDVMPWHIKIELQAELTAKFKEKIIWAKCDMLNTVAFHRLDRLYSRLPNGRKYYTRHVSDGQLMAINHGVLAYLGHTCHITMFMA